MIFPTFILLVTVLGVHSMAVEQTTAKKRLSVCELSRPSREDRVPNDLNNMNSDAHETRHMYCIIACMSKKLKLLDDENKVNIARFDGYVKERMERNGRYPNLYPKVRFCATQVMSEYDECNMVEQLYLCVSNLMKNQTNVNNVAKQYGR